MKILDKLEQNTDEWADCRLGKVTGSKLHGLIVKRGTKKKIGFYELMAERIAVKEAWEDPMERGHRLEDEAIKAFEEKTGKQVEQVGFCIHDKYPDIALSPDGLIKIKGKYKEAVEAKCLSSARHLQAYFEKQIPSEYEEQVAQYFIVDEDLETLHFVFYDPRITALPLHIIEITRVEYQGKADVYLEYQINSLKEIDQMLEELVF